MAYMKRKKTKCKKKKSYKAKRFIAKRRYIRRYQVSNRIAKPVAFKKEYFNYRLECKEGFVLGTNTSVAYDNFFWAFNVQKLRNILTLVNSGITDGVRSHTVIR